MMPQEQNGKAREFVIRGKNCRFMPVEDFQELYHLDSDFAVKLFQPKDYDGLGSIEGAGAALRQLYEKMLRAIPRQTPRSGWRAFLLELQITFRQHLAKMNKEIGLKGSEIDYAVLNFGAISQEFLNRMINAQMSGKAHRCFEEVYRDWLNSTIEISTPYYYAHYDELWQIEIVRHAYGRLGMVIETGHSSYYVYDASLACPAESFMESLSRAVAETISEVYLIQAD